MKTYHPMATYDGKTDNFHTLITYDSLNSISECLEVFETWLSYGFKIDRMWIQEFELGEKTPIREIEVELKPVIVEEE